MLSANDDAVGGYFELELPSGVGEKYPNSLKYQSARAAFRALLEHHPNINRVWMPNYICDTMLAAVTQAKKIINFYSIGPDFAPVDKVYLEADDILFYVNYFGLCGENAKAIIGEYGAEQVVIDCSQAFFSEPYECLATIYSPRKFFGIPDGGLLVTQRKISPPAEQDEGSYNRTNHLLQRLAFSAEQGYENYKIAEDSLKLTTPKRMSQLTSVLFASVDHEAIKIKRLNNFKALHKGLGKYNTLQLRLNKNASPLCYPFLPNRYIEKHRLIGKRIFLPTYWPEVRLREKLSVFERILVDELLAVPCDQRCSAADMSRTIQEIENELLSPRA